MKTEVLARDLQPGDRLDMGFYPYGSATVTRVDNEYVYLLRPYVHFDRDTDISYIGTENMTLWRKSERSYTRIEL